MLVDGNESSTKKRTTFGCQDTPGFKFLGSNLSNFRAFDQPELLKVVGTKLHNGINTPKVNIDSNSHKKKLDFIQFTLSKPLSPTEDSENKENNPILAKKPPRAKPINLTHRPLPSLKKRLMA